MLDSLLEALPAPEEHFLASKALGEGLLRRVGEELIRIGISGTPGADQAMSRTLGSERSLGSHDRRFVADLAYGGVRDRRILERILALDGNHSPGPADLWRTQLCLAHGAGDLKGALQDPSASLRRWATTASPMEILAEIGSLPDWLAESLLEELGPKEAAEAAVGFRSRAPMTLRVNGQKTDRNTLQEILSTAGIPTEVGSLSEDALVVLARANLQALKSWRDGWFEVQDEGSQLIAALVSPPRGGRVVDFCAGAGGKSLALAHKLPQRTRILGLDPRQRPIEEARKRARRAGAKRLEFQVLAPDAPVPVAPASVHRVLVDAPCTGTGRLRRQPAARWSMDRDAPTSLANLQSEILARAAPLVRPGGRLIYATCSVLRKENEEQVEAFLATHRGWELMPTKELLGKKKAMQTGNGLTLRTWPHRHGCDGFFGAVLVRKD